MAFYPDELSPIDRSRGTAKSGDLIDINLITKSRRQWKTLVLGKKDMPLNNFDTITEEKEEDMSSDGSRGGNPKPTNVKLENVGNTVENKKIMFPKPRKYITSRAADRREITSLPAMEDSAPVPSGTPVEDKNIIDEDLMAYTSQKVSANTIDAKYLIKGKSSNSDMVMPYEVPSYTISDFSIDKSWSNMTGNLAPLTGWPKAETSKPEAKSDPIKPKPDDKKKSATGSVRNPFDTSIESKNTNVIKNYIKPKVSVSEDNPSKAAKPDILRKLKSDKGKPLNMKEVVNVYKNLTYGTKDEIKTFVERLDYVKDEPKSPGERDLLSVLNLKALESKIKDLGKKSTKADDSLEGKKKNKPLKKTRKAHIERLARHKAVKVPATLDYTYSVSKQTLSYGSSVSGATPLTDKEIVMARRNKQNEEKAPWRYVGAQSTLDKNYLVYPVYPPPVPKKVARKSKPEGDKSENKKEKKQKTSNPVQPIETEKKVKPSNPSEVISRQSFGFKSMPRAIRSSPTCSFGVPGSYCRKDSNRNPATTVCTVEFPCFEEFDRKEPNSGLLLYVHGSKPKIPRPPVCDKQFSRVKYFRKSLNGEPLIRGASKRSLTKNFSNPVSVKNLKLPDTMSRLKFVDLLDFEEDIQNINDFLHSEMQEQPEPLQNIKLSKEPQTQELTEHLQIPDNRFSRSLNPQHHHQHTARATKVSPDLIFDEISKDLQHFQNLPDTEENRRLIAHFFDELDQRIEETKAQQLMRNANQHYARMIPIIGY